MRKVILSLLILFLFQIILFGQSTKKEFTLENVFQSPQFYARSVYGIVPLNDGNSYCMLQADSILVYDYKTGEKTATIVTKDKLIPEGDTIPISMRGFDLSNDESKILFSTKVEQIYRHSSKAEFYIYDREIEELQRLSSNGKQRLADFSPDASKVAFIRDNNLFVKDLITGYETPVTRDGKVNSIIYGTTDWVYEEEFGFTKAFFWSPDGNKIAYYRFDESNVKEYQLAQWGDLYPEYYKYKYPKAGEDNSIVSIHVYDIATGETSAIDTGTETDIYIPRIKWTNDSNKLSIQWMNRLQNELKILVADINEEDITPIYIETNKYYIDITDNLTFLKDNERFIFTNETNGYHHIYMYKMDGSLIGQITQGKWDVTNIYGIDEEREIIYYGSSESSPLNRDFYQIGFDGKGKKLLSTKEGDNRIQFSKKYNYYINTFSDASTPTNVTVNSSKGKMIRVLKDNSYLLDTLKNYTYSSREFFSFTTTEGINLNGWMIKPYDFDPTKKYPVLMYVYGGPGSQTVRNNWGGGNLWYQMLSSKGIVIVSVDNRGTGARGEEFKKMTYMELGKYETEDQIEAAKYLASLDYIDKDRIGIWGWSYGGYMSTSCLTKGADYFSMGVAVAPVTNWRYYDNIYTERFMRTPQENPDGYDENSPINHVDNLKGKFLLIHGTADDNVHIQNSVDLITALVAANKQFDMQFYPNSNHGIYTGRNTRIHLYKRITDFIYDNLLLEE
ncbi:MAG: S9 family peptidase [Bacteroidetes bacterium]|nr:MAG: S9 family peptidase [Bacteroidota bacterium]